VLCNHEHEPAACPARFDVPAYNYTERERIRRTAEPDHVKVCTGCNRVGKRGTGRCPRKGCPRPDAGWLLCTPEEAAQRLVTAPTPPAPAWVPPPANEAREAARAALDLGEQIARKPKRRKVMRPRPDPNTPNPSTSGPRPGWLLTDNPPPHDWLKAGTYPPVITHRWARHIAEEIAAHLPHLEPRLHHFIRFGSLQHQPHGAAFYATYCQQLPPSLRQHANWLSEYLNVRARLADWHHPIPGWPLCLSCPPLEKIPLGPLDQLANGPLFSHG
jgi:hypothetical protein